MASRTATRINEAVAMLLAIGQLVEWCPNCPNGIRLHGVRRADM